MKTNKRVVTPAPRNHEGNIVPRISKIEQLRRTVLTCMLWEDGFYEDGKTVAARIAELVPQCNRHDLYQLAYEARNEMKLRHVPLLLVREMARHPNKGVRTMVASALNEVIQRPDELAEFLSIYWKDKRQPLSAQVKKGLARAFGKFNEYQLSKYDREGAIKLRDVMFMVHPNPNPARTTKFTAEHRRSVDWQQWRQHRNVLKITERELLYHRVAQRELETADTWETRLSAGADKKESFEDLMREKKLGALAFLRNLRNMRQAGISTSTLAGYATQLNLDRILPFRFISAAQAVPELEPLLETMMLRCLAGESKLRGKTALIVDTSPSMWMDKISAKSEMTRFDAAAALAILVREVSEEVAVYAFNRQAYVVAPRRGFALRDLLRNTRGNASRGGLAVEMANKDGYDRIIVLTDGEWHHYQDRQYYDTHKPTDLCPDPLTKRAYMINMQVSQYGVGYGKWLTINGWSEAIIPYIRALEQKDLL